MSINDVLAYWFPLDETNLRSVDRLHRVAIFCRTRSRRRGHAQALALLLHRAASGRFVE
jgi:hypothetical protein